MIMIPTLTRRGPIRRPPGLVSGLSGFVPLFVSIKSMI